MIINKHKIPQILRNYSVIYLKKRAKNIYRCMSFVNFFQNINNKIKSPGANNYPNKGVNQAYPKGAQKVPKPTNLGSTTTTTNPIEKVNDLQLAIAKLDPKAITENGSSLQTHVYNHYQLVAFIKPEPGDDEEAKYVVLGSFTSSNKYISSFCI